MAAQTLSSITCEQVYNIWKSEPELIVLLDLRSKEEYDIAHIPGASHLDMSLLTNKLKSLGEKLAVLILESKDQAFVQQICQGFDNYIVLGDCSRWKQLHYPIRGEGLSLVQNDFMKIFDQGATMKNDLIFHQLFEAETSTYTYIIADAATKEAAIIDPVLETVDRDVKLIEELGLKLVYALDTHIHADHVTGAGELRKRFALKTAVSAEADVACVDIPLEDGQELLLGNKKIKVIATPGHTNTCLTFAFEGMIFTGDSLLIRSCGRTDFQQGSSEKLYSSVRDKLFQLPNETIIYPGHDYRGQTSSTIGAEKKFNSRLNENISLEDFKKIMSELKLAHPKKIHAAVPANLACGKLSDLRVLHPQVVDGIPEVTVEDLFAHYDEIKAKKIRLIDVRGPDEYNNELGHIEGAELLTLGAELTHFLQEGDRNQEIVFICRSGGRSGNATAESIQMGYKFTINMAGGMLRWNEKQQPVVSS